MWAPHPRGRIIRRPQPDFSHRRSRIQQRPGPKELLDAVPDPRCNYKYFGIHRSDITDHLKIAVPSHAFHPSKVGKPPPVIRGRGPCNVKPQRRPETAPASTVWFGRTCSDVSDWLRYRPPAHLGLDPDNKPLPSYPTSSSLVTDPKWQTKEFPAVPNVLWHWWKERPSSVPLATNPQQVKFDTLVHALKDRAVRPVGTYTPPTSAAATPRSEAQTPRNCILPPNGERKTHPTWAQTPRHLIPTCNEETFDGELQSRALTPRLQGSGERLDPMSIRESPVRPASNERSSTLPSRPGSAPNGTSFDASIPSPQGKPSPNDCSPRPPSTPKHRSFANSPRSSQPLGPCGCEKFRDTSSSSHVTRGVGTSTPPLDVRSPQNQEQKSVCSSSQVPIPRLNLQENGATLCKPPTPTKIPTPTLSSGKPPPSPRPSHPNPPHDPRQATPCKPCAKHHAAIPSGLYVQGQGSDNRLVERKTLKAEIERARQGLTIDDMNRLSPDSFATKIVWAEKLKMQGQRLQSWPFEDKKKSKAVKAY